MDESSSCGKKEGIACGPNGGTFLSCFPECNSGHVLFHASSAMTGCFPTWEFPLWSPAIEDMFISYIHLHKLELVQFVIPGYFINNLFLAPLLMSTFCNPLKGKHAGANVFSFYLRLLLQIACLALSSTVAFLFVFLYYTVVNGMFEQGIKKFPLDLMELSYIES